MRLPRLFVLPCGSAWRCIASLLMHASRWWLVATQEVAVVFTSLVAALVGLFREDDHPASGADFVVESGGVGTGYWDDRCTFCGVHHPVYEGDRLDPWVRFRARPSLV